MTTTLTDIVNVLAQTRIAVAVAQSIGVSVPAEITNFENLALTAIGSIQEFSAPDSLSSDIADVTVAAKALSSVISVPSLTGIATALTKIKSFDQDLTSGNAAILGVVGASFDGVTDKIVFVAYRESGSFAKLVDEGDSGTTDSAVIGS